MVQLRLLYVNPPLRITNKTFHNFFKCPYKFNYLSLKLKKKNL